MSAKHRAPRPALVKTKQEETETKEFTNTGKALIESLMQRHRIEMGQALDMIGSDLGVKPEDGWEPDVRAGVFRRPIPPKKEDSK